MARLAHPLAAALLLAACSADESAPSPAQQRQLESAENLLDDAPGQLETVNEQLPAQQ